MGVDGCGSCTWHLRWETTSVLRPLLTGLRGGRKWEGLLLCVLTLFWLDNKQLFSFQPIFYRNLCPSPLCAYVWGQPRICNKMILESTLLPFNRGLSARNRLYKVKVDFASSKGWENWQTLLFTFRGRTMEFCLVIRTSIWPSLFIPVGCISIAQTYTCRSEEHRLPLYPGI